MRRTSFLLFLALGLAMSQSGLAQSFHYAENCITSVNNATTIIPSTADPSLPNGASLAPGDTIAIQNGNGDCVGYGVWAGTETSLAIAAAGASDLSEVPSGLEPGEPLSWTVFDESEESVVKLGREVVYASCDRVDVPTCRDDGAYADGALFLLEAFSRPVYARAVTGAST